jgi:hypothetical protein
VCKQERVDHVCQSTAYAIGYLFVPRPGKRQLSQPKRATWTGRSHIPPPPSRATIPTSHSSSSPHSNILACGT